MAQSTVMMMLLAVAFAPLVLCDTVCQPGAQLTFILQLPQAGTQPTAFTNSTLTNAVSGVVSANGFPSGINNIQIASTTSCNVTTCGTGNNYLAAVSFNYAAGISFNNTATAAQRAFSSGAFQNNLDSIQGKQGLQLLGLPQVMDLCTGTVIAGPALLSLTAAAPGSSFLNNGLPTIFIAFTVSAPNTTVATKATTGTTVANAISGVISSFGSYGLNNPTVVAFTNCTLCTPTSANLSDYTMTMTFAYSTGFTFKGLSQLFYAAFNASAFQGNLNNLDSTLSLVAITQILDFDNPSTYVGLPPPPPPPAYLSERLLFSAAQLANIDFVADYVATHLSFYTQQGGFYFNYYDANGKYYYVRIPFLEPTPDIISLPFDTGSEVAELWQVDYEIQGFTTNYGQPNPGPHNTTAQLQTLVLALAASFKAQGLFVVPQNVQLFDIWYTKLGLTNAPTRRLQQTGAQLAACPSGAVCSTSVSIAFPQGDDMDAADFAQALYNITSSGIMQGAVQLLSNQTWLLQPLAITTVSAASLAYSPPPASIAPPPPPMTGRQITAVYRIAKSLNSTELTIFKAALAQLLQPYGVVSSYISIGTPTPVTGRRLLQAGVSYDYPVTIQVPGTTSSSTLETYLQSSSGQSALAAAIASNGGSFSASLQSVSDSSSGTEGSTSACKQHFGHWCIDNSRVSRGGIIAIIVCGSFFVLCLLVLIPLFALSARRRRRAAKP